MSGAALDLVVVYPCDAIQSAVQGIVAQHHKLGTRPIRAAFRLEPGRDPGCYHRGHQLVRHEANRCRHALVVFDQAWDGVPRGEAEDLEREVEGLLRGDWGDRARCVVIAPEVEAWVFSTSPHVARVLGWPSNEELRRFLAQQSPTLWADGEAKPRDPKAAMHAALFEKRRVKPSAALFGELAKNVSLERCEDRSFLKLRETLREWFPQGQTAT